jgi:hypothetical protein
MNRQSYRPTGSKKKGDLTVARVGSTDGSHRAASAILRRQPTSLYVILFRLALSSRRIDYFVCENFPNKLLSYGIGQPY